jgi:hypothetical protein
MEKRSNYCRAGGRKKAAEVTAQRTIRSVIVTFTRGGMSGSPVVLRTQSGYLSKKKNFVVATGINTLFLGIYSAQLNALELGHVWKPHVLTELLLKIP